MTNDLNSKTDAQKPVLYEIRIEGHLGSQWANWFGDAHITLEEDGNTRLACPVIDQAALFGLLKKVRDLGMSLVSVIRVGSVQSMSQMSHDETHHDCSKEK